MASHVTRPSLSLEGARAALDAALEACAGEGVAATVCVVDAGGAAVASARMDGAALFTGQVAADKAYTAAASGMPTANWAGILGDDAVLTARLTSGVQRLVTLGGGLPITLDGAVIGAIGVSGGTEEQDAAAAAAGVKAVGTD